MKYIVLLTALTFTFSNSYAKKKKSAKRSIAAVSGQYIYNTFSVGSDGATELGLNRMQDWINNNCNNNKHHTVTPTTVDHPEYTTKSLLVFCVKK